MSVYQPIIQSLPGTDLHKFTILQVVLHQFPQIHSLYEFRCHNKEMVYPLADIQEELECEFDVLCQLCFTHDELDYLCGLRSIENDFADYLELFQLQRHFVKVSPDDQGRLNTRIKGPMVQAMFSETFILAIISELHLRRLETPAVIEGDERRLQAKMQQLKRIATTQNPNNPPFLISGFGTHRRYAPAWQEHVICAPLEAAPGIIRGISNVYLAKKLGITPVDTMAHESLQASQASGVRLRNFQETALESWVHRYRGDLGIALTGVIGMSAFLRGFGLYFAKLFDGLHHDSGDPCTWGNEAYEYYRKPKIDNHTKMLTFLDSLDIGHSQTLHQYFKDCLKTSFGIGTNLTNDLGHTPLSIILKLIECNGQSVVRLSDSSGKIMTTNSTFFAYLRQVFDVLEPKEKA